MRDITNPEKNKLIQTGQLTTVGGAALAIIFMQIVAFNAFMDSIMSVALVGTGYLACWLRMRK